MQIIRMAVVAAGALALAVPAFAQNDPAASRSESQVNSLNRSIDTQQQNRAVQQQNQFETNALRNELSRPASPPIVTTNPLGPGAIRR